MSLFYVDFIWKQPNKHQHENKNNKGKHWQENFLEKSKDKTLLTLSNFVNFPVCLCYTFILFLRNRIN